MPSTNDFTNTPMVRGYWRRLPFAIASAPELLAGAEALLLELNGTEQAAIRWSVVAEPALFLGSSQRLSEADWQAAATSGVTVHKRRSGGGAVFIDAGMLWLDVALPVGHRLLPTDITAAYRWLGETWAEALQLLGIAACALPPDEARTLNAALDPRVQRVCFGGISPYEVFVGQRKLVGLAQVRRRSGGLLQCGVYAHWQPERITALLSATAAERAELLDLVAGRAWGLRDLASDHVKFDEVIRAWEQALVARHNILLADDDWTAEERAAASALYPKYAALSAPSVG